MAQILRKRDPRVYHVGETVDSSERYLLVRKRETYKIYTSSGPLRFETNSATGSPRPAADDFGYVGLNVQSLRTRKTALIELLQSYLRNEIRGELFLTEKPVSFLPARHIWFIIKALRLLNTEPEGKDHIADMMIARLRSASRKPPFLWVTPDWLLEEIFYSLKASEELDRSSLPNHEQLRRDLARRILSRKSRDDKMWGAWQDDVFHDRLRETYYAIAALGTVNHSLSTQEINDIRQSLNDPWHFPHQGLQTGIMNAWAGVNLLLEIDEPITDLPRFIEWLDKMPVRSASTGTGVSRSSLGFVVKGYYTISTLEKLRVKSRHIEKWKELFLNYLSKPYWQISPAEIALSLLSLNMIAPVSLP